MRKVISVMLSAVMLCCFATGCGSKASETKPIADVQNEAKTMSMSQLESVVNEYKAALEAKKVEIQALQEKMKKIPITQLLGDEAKAIKDDMSKVATSVQALAERMNVYVKEIQAKQAAGK